MRVFDIYTYNIVSIVKFKDTKKYVDTMLEELGLTYNNVAFTYRGFLTPLGAMVEKYPNLSKYVHHYMPFRDDIITSLTPDWSKGQVYADKEDWDSLFQIVSKCPRGMNIIPTLAFDGIDWYGEGVKPSVIGYLNEHMENGAQTFGVNNVIGNQIIMQREYDYGNKYNILQVVVEATGDGGKTPRDTSDIVEKLEKYLGKPERFVRTCRYSREKEKEFRKKSSLCENILKERIETFYPRKVKFDEVPFIPNLADKKKITEAFQGTCFELGSRKGLLPGMNRMLCKDTHNFQYEILFDRTQTSPDYFYWYVYIKGHNFRISSNQNTMYASSGKEAKERLAEIAGFCATLADEFGDMLATHFGDTPDWYIEND